MDRLVLNRQKLPDIRTISLGNLRINKGTYRMDITKDTSGNGSIVITFYVDKQDPSIEKPIMAFHLNEDGNVNIRRSVYRTDGTYSHEETLVKDSDDRPFWMPEVVLDKTKVELVTIPFLAPEVEFDD